MTLPHYRGDRVDGKPRLSYHDGAKLIDITFVLEESGITFIANFDWKACDKRLVELAQTILWHYTRCHRFVSTWAQAFANELLGFLDDGWRILAARVSHWVAAKQAEPGTVKPCNPPPPVDGLNGIA